MLRIRHVSIELLVLCLIAIASCNNSRLAVSGNVMVDGKPLEEGTIHFQSDGDPDIKEVGAAVHGGEFELPVSRRLPPGRYRVFVSGFRKTGKMVSDPQRGKVAEIVPLNLIDSPQTLEISGENARQIQIKLKAST
jgi:hypothetical protein